MEKREARKSLSSNNFPSLPCIQKDNLKISKLVVKISILVFAIGMCFSTYGVAVSIPDYSDYQGSFVQIPVNVDNAEGVVGFQFTITFNSDVLQATGVQAGSLTDNWLITPNITVQGQIKVAGADETLTGLSNFRGSLIILNFNVVGAPGSSTNLNFTSCKLVDIEGKIISSTFNGGNFTVKSLITNSASGGGCFIATACFGNYNHPIVKILREFRDKFLVTNRIGKIFVRWYYSHSPRYAEIISNSPVLKGIVRILLIPFVIFAYLCIKSLILPLILLTLFLVISKYFVDRIVGSYN
ncbi:MAG: cohesin domain-containing protein [Candidatus Omnitrophica bacterium]|nr:cohesin domain-containing protein [Candidatus Omnitrophota bacterium]MCM8802541.1 cohesin domain-containing protein [Candidatus Omnitrophota bacterium]